MTDQLGRADQLRTAFDEGFARAPDERVIEMIDVLAIRSGGRPYALLLSEIRALHVMRAVVPIPSPEPALLGVSTLRGEILPVYDLERLLGERSDGSAPRWLAQVRAKGPLVVAFQEFEGYWRLPASDVSLTDAARAGKTAFGSVTRSHDSRPLLHLPSLCGALWQSPDTAQQTREESR